MAEILIIDDEENIRVLLGALVKSLGHNYRAADDGTQGLKLYREQPANLVITDLVMPEQEGLSVIIELRKLNPAVRIIAISGGFVHDPNLYLKMAKKLGADLVLSKPFEIVALKSAVTSLLPAQPQT